MSKNSVQSKTIAVIVVIVAIAAVWSLVGMTVYFEIRKDTLNMTPPATAPSTTLAPPPERRLRGDVLPDFYNIFIKVYFYPKFIEEVNVTTPNQTLYFDGNVTIDFHCVQQTKSIFLHSRHQNISNPRVRNRNSGKHLKVEGYSLQNEDDFLEIRLKEKLEVGGNYSLSLDFSADVNENLDGLFLSTYREGVPDSEEDPYAVRYLVATNMEPTSARTVFPCFDEPAMKARFKLTVIHRRDTTALANEKENESDSGIGDDGWMYTHFLPTPVMSTYLFAFTVSEMTGKQHPNPDITIYARPEAIKAGHADYAVHITGDILEFYEKEFGNGLAYNHKLDQIALPDLGPAAMENWGLVTYQEGVLLYEEGVSSEQQKEVIAFMIAHELAHQWFGNLVTMKWWNEVWLNEGFATYMSSLAVDNKLPSLKVMEMVIANELQSALEADALASSHPLSPPASEVQTTDEIMELFDLITYNKGSAVLRMLADALTEKVFKNGIKIYLNKFKEKNTDQYDLWDAMKESQSGSSNRVDIVNMMDKWTHKSGYPVITINTTSGAISQKQFLYNDTSESSTLWHIPIKVLTGFGEKRLEWLEKDKAIKPIFESKKGEWILANVNCTGFYRVNYDLENWARLLNELETKPQGIPLLNRGQLIDDAFNLARAKQVSVSLALNSTRFLRNETDYLPWDSAMRNLHYFVLMFDRSEVYGPMQNYLRNQVTVLYNFFNNLNNTNNSTVPEGFSSQNSQILSIRVACANGLPECVQMAKGMFHTWMTSNDTNEIHPNLRSVIYCQAIAAGGQDEWEFAWQRLQSSTDTSEKEQLREALTCTKKVWLLNRYLEYTLDPVKIRLMDVSSVISSIAQNEAGHALAWNFLRANWDYVSQLHGAYLIQEVTSRFSTPFELEELKTFEAKYDLGSAALAVQNAIEQTRVNIQWVKGHRETVLDWFLAETS